VGPYDFSDTVDWGKVLQGDRFYVLLQIRALTYGDEYAFAVPCAHCRSRIEWELDLNDLPLRLLKAKSREQFQDGNRFETTVDGHKITFRLLTGADERKLPQLKRQAQDHLLSAILNFRITDIDGIR